MYHRFNEADLLKPDTFQGAAQTIANECVDLMISKQKDYGKSNILNFGEFGVLVRANDKFERLKNLTKKGKEPNNESIEDTLMDICNYMIIYMMLRRGQFELPLEG